MQHHATCMQFAKQFMTNRALRLLYDTMKTTGEVFKEIGVTCLHKPAIIFLRQEFSSLALAGKLDLSLEEEIFKGIVHRSDDRKDTFIMVKEMIMHCIAEDIDFSTSAMLGEYANKMEGCCSTFFECLIQASMIKIVFAKVTPSERTEEMAVHALSVDMDVIMKEPDWAEVVHEMKKAMREQWLQYDRVPGCENPLFDAWNITPISYDDMTEMVEHCIVQSSPKIAIPGIILPRKLRQVLFPATS